MLGDVPFIQLKLTNEWLRKGRKSVGGERIPNFKSFDLYWLNYRVSILVIKFTFFFFLTGEQYEDETDLEVRSFWKRWVEGTWFWGSLVSFLKVANLWNYKCPSVIYGQVEILCINRSSEYFTPKFPCSASFP